MLNAGEPGRKFLLKTIGRRDGAVLCRISLSRVALSRTNERCLPHATRRPSRLFPPPPPPVSHHCRELFATHKIRQFPCVCAASRRCYYKERGRERAVRESCARGSVVRSSLRLPPVRAHTFAWASRFSSLDDIYYHRPPFFSRECCHCRRRGETSVTHTVLRWERNEQEGGLQRTSLSCPSRASRALNGGARTDEQLVRSRSRICFCKDSRVRLGDAREILVANVVRWPAAAAPNTCCSHT